MADAAFSTRRTVLGGAVALVGAALVGGTSGCTDRSKRSTEGPIGQEGGVLDGVLERKVLRAGYSGFKPYTISNPRAPSEPTGFVVDIVHEIVQRMDPPIRVLWHPVTFEALSADISSGRVDVFTDAVYFTIPRAQRFIYTKPLGYFGVGAAVVRRSDNRFATVMDLDRPGIVISLAQGWTATEFAQRTFRHARLDIVPVGDDGSVPLQNVVAGRADAALQDVPTVAQFVAANATVVKGIDIDRPPARVAAGFLLPRNAIALRDFFDVALEVLRSDGTFKRIAERWQLYNDFEARDFSSAPSL